MISSVSVETWGRHEVGTVASKVVIAAVMRRRLPNHVRDYPTTAPPDLFYLLGPSDSRDLARRIASSRLEPHHTTSPQRNRRAPSASSQRV